MPTILIVDDDQDVQEMARVVLTRQGYCVLVESSASAGIATARHELPDLILMDVSMPGLDGWTATRLVKSDPALAHIPVVAWTATTIRGGEAGARAAGYDGYLPKPIELDRFVEQVNAFLPGHQAPEAPVPSSPPVAPLKLPAAAYLAQARLLLVADDDATCQEIRQWLVSQGNDRCWEATTASAALQVARANHLDLVLLDLGMSKVDGWDILRLLHSEPCLETAPVIVILGTGAVQADATRALSLGADDYVHRPVNWDGLAVRLSGQLRIKLLEDRLRRRQADLRVLYRAGQVLSASLDLSTVLTTILEEAAASVGATRSGLYLLDADLRLIQQLHAGGASDLPPEALETIIERGTVRWVISHLEPMLVDDVLDDPRWVSIEQDTSSRSAAVVPIVGREGVLGVLALSHEQVGHFSQEHIGVLSALAAQAAIALENARLFEQVRGERQKLGAILDNSADAVVVVDNDKCITLVNGVAEQLLGLRADAIGCPVNQKLASSPLMDLFDSAAERGEPVSRELEIRGGAYHASVHPVPDVGQVALLQDISLLKELEKMKLERERQEAERVRRQFARHMSPRIVELLLKRGETLSMPRKVKAAVLFSDLRNFTSLTERIGVDAMMEYVLKRYIAVMTDMIYAHEGTITKLLGDGIMAVFGVPIHQANAPQRALRTAMVMLRALAVLRVGWLRDLNQDISMGIGLGWGEVIAGDIGSSQLMDYTVIGDPVNTAARLGEIAAPGQVLLPEALAEVVGDGPEWRLESLPPVKIKGKESPQKIYQAMPTWPAL
jgi:PAS domain S-box-containing protein